eukprot:scaffold661_cov162-Ochromonas_danica.AAC.2
MIVTHRLILITILSLLFFFPTTTTTTTTTTSTSTSPPPSTTGGGTSSAASSSSSSSITSGITTSGSSGNGGVLKLDDDTTSTSTSHHFNHRVFNFASSTAGAVILDKYPPHAKGFHHLLNDDKDKYGIASCNEMKWVVIGLAEDILITSITLANYEKYSSMIQDFQLLASTTYPPSTTLDWLDLGIYRAEPRLGEQTFNITRLADYYPPPPPPPPPPAPPPAAASVEMIHMMSLML